MPDRIKYLFILSFLCMICFCNKSVVQGYTGNGSKDKPYIVTKESEIREILTTKGSSSWKYIAVNNTIVIKRTITVSNGKFRLYAKGTERTIKRSGEISDPVNNNGAPKYCIIVNGNSNVVFGYQGGSNYLLKLGGNKAKFTGNKKSSGFLYVDEGATVTLDEKSVLINVRNNKSDQGGTAVFSIGNLIVNGEISNCEGTDGGAVGIKRGNLFIHNTAHIHDCSSATEGGGVFGIDGCNIEMTGGIIRSCTAKEEGGGLFVSGKANCKIIAGNIMNNSSGLTGGGVFSGGGATITIGKADGSGPNICSNYAGTIGGGIRCNGGSGVNSGGNSYFYGGTISDNTAERNTGGLSCGPAGDKFVSKIYVKGMNIENNVGKGGIGGMRIPASAIGTNSKEVSVINCRIQGNKTQKNSGGLQVDGSVIVTNSAFTRNYSQKNGGGIYINNGTLLINSGTVAGNGSDGNGAGIYVGGTFKIRDSANIDDGNEVYLTSGTYIDVVGKLSKVSGLIARINSEVNVNGTKLVKANYSGGSAQGELYHADGKNSERYQCISMAKYQLLRPSENVNGYENIWIIISEKYKIQYDKNTTDSVKNMPKEQEKYWNEDIVLSKNQITREGYVLEEEKHWNTKKEESGIVYFPGSVYKENTSITLYARWKQIMIKEIYINATDRYYVIHQKVLLDSKELLKKVTTDDDLNTGNSYKLRVTKIDKIDHSNIARGSNIITENYFNTNVANRYILTIETEDEISKVKASTKMYVHVVNKNLSTGQVRFISYDYLYTLDNMSKWSDRLKNRLVTSLEKKDNSFYQINMSVDDIKEIKNNIKKNNYKINNIMNRRVVGKLGI